MIKVPISLINKYLVCSICKGYYVNAVTITGITYCYDPNQFYLCLWLLECLQPHTFCRNCLIDRLKLKPGTSIILCYYISGYVWYVLACPVCDTYLGGDSLLKYRNAKNMDYKSSGN